MRLSHSYSRLNTYENCPRRYHHQYILKDVVDKGGQAAEWGVQVHEDLEKRLRDGAALPDYCTKYEPLVSSVERIADGGQLLTEQQLALNDSLEPTEWFAEDTWLRGILDVLVLRGKQAIVLDWKTGKRRPDETQLRIFAVQTMKHYPSVETVTSGFVWLKDMAIDKFTYRRPQFNGIWAGLAQRFQRIHNSLEDDRWPAKPSGLCRYCPARHMCPDAQL